MTKGPATAAFGTLPGARTAWTRLLPPAPAGSWLGCMVLCAPPRSSRRSRRPAPRPAPQSPPPPSTTHTMPGSPPAHTMPALFRPTLRASRCSVMIQYTQPELYMRSLIMVGILPDGLGQIRLDGKPASSFAPYGGTILPDLSIDARRDPLAGLSSVQKKHVTGISDLTSGIDVHKGDSGPIRNHRVADHQDGNIFAGYVLELVNRLGLLEDATRCSKMPHCTAMLVDATHTFLPDVTAPVLEKSGLARHVASYTVRLRSDMLSHCRCRFSRLRHSQTPERHASSTVQGGVYVCQ